MDIRCLLMLVVIVAAVTHAKPEWKRTYELLKDRRSAKNTPEKRQTGASLEIRLVDGDNEYEGRVEVNMHPHGWGTVCNDGFGDEEARVACRMLGYQDGFYVFWGFRAGSGTIALDELNCDGGETDLWDCEHDEWGVSDCMHVEDAGIRCDPGGSGPARLVSLGGDNENEGRLEVNSPSHGWGTVCDDDFEESEAQVACRMLGLYGGEVLWTEFDSDGSGTIGLASVSCDGTEATLFDCQHNDWGNNNCNHFQDVAIKCVSEPLSTTVRLVDGENEWSGRVEVLHEGVWGTVCDDRWDNVDATVVCKSLGYERGDAVREAEYGPGSGPILLDEVECAGTERYLEDCPKSPWGEQDCSHSEDAGVRCSRRD